MNKFEIKNLQNYNHLSYRLSTMPENFCKEKFPIGNGIITVHSYNKMKPKLSLFEKFLDLIGFNVEHEIYRVTLWFNDEIASFADVDPGSWNKNNMELKHEIITSLFKATEKEV